jgi:hypothetical protein
VNGRAGERVSIRINQASAIIRKSAQITATLKREDFDDYPHYPIPYYADNDIDMLRSGLINTDGEVSRRAGYLWYCGGHGTRANGTKIPCGGHVAYEDIEASFSDIADEVEYTANVYNGLEELPYIKQLTREKTKSSEKFKYNLHWEGTHYPFKVVRYMCHLDEANREYGWEAVNGQYERTFIGQSSGTITWQTVQTMEDFYEKDRKAATNRLTGQGNYDHAVFATDKLLQNYSWPIKSGYYFNPGGTYQCTVYTAQYKNSEGGTAEHAQLVEAVKNAFCYDSALIYVNKNQNYGKLGDITMATPRGLLKTETPEAEKKKKTTWISTTSKRAEEAVIAVDDLYKEVMEGYKESWTEDSYKAYKYLERTDKTVSGQDIWLVEETTVVYFKVGIPPELHQKLYTHVNMKNGDYAILTKVGKIEFDFEEYLNLADSGEYEHDSVLTMDAFNLDGIKVTVSGSMYDDR